MDSAIDNYINKSVLFVDEISSKFKYNENVRHLLYLVVPSFLAYYGMGKYKAIKEIFSEIPIYVGRETGTVSARFERYQMGDKLLGRVMISGINSNSISDLVDQIVHEYNHAINSYHKGLKDKLIRTGMSYSTKGKKDKYYIFEEVINTYQSTEIIEFIKKIDENLVSNKEVANTIYNIKNDHSGKFESKGYQLYVNLLKDLLSSKSLMLTLEDNRFFGDIDSFIKYFDSILYDGSFEKLNDMLIELSLLIEKYSKAKLFKNTKLSRIRDKAFEISNLIKEFKQNSIY